MKDLLGISILFGIVFIVCASLTISLNNSNTEYRYNICVERQFTYDKVDIDTAKINCKKVWKE